MSTQLAAAGAHSASDSGEYPTRVPDPPPVIMSAAHRKECKVFQGDAFPSMHVKALDGDSVSVEKLIEEGPTLIVFWKSGHFYSEALIEDLNADGPGNPIAAYSELPIIAIRVGAVGKQSALTNDTLRKHGRVDHYIDEQEEAFAKVGTERFPRAYLLDSNGQITWLDTEYSRSTRRALGIGIRSLMAH